MIPLWSQKFSPNALPNLAAWYRFGQGISTSGSAVSQWDDASGNGRHLLQATGAAQPTLQGDNTILFDGTTDFLQTNAFTLNQPETVYLLGKQVTYTSSDSVYCGDANNSGKLIQTGTTPSVSINAGSSVAANTDWIIDTYMATVAVFNGASSSFRVNNNAETTGNAGAGNMGGFALGDNGDGAAFANIQVKEVIIYNAAHDAATRSQVIAYLLSL